MKYSIEIKKLTKEYKLYKNDKDRFKDLFGGKRYTTYVALNNLSIDLHEGEVIGILGKNGSGKSTLLKMITGVVFPTSGDIKVNGKVSALLELTAGFDSELTGRENIYLKGYGLGLERKFIDKKIDSIIDFAEIGEYIDQPVRMYSSGMKSRLGFAISVNIDPDILVVDEALAVGDEIFRQKCLNKMSEIKRMGKTILFVSHSIGQIKSFCTKGMWLHEGNMIFYGDIDEVSSLYEQYLKGVSVEEIIANPEKYKNIIQVKQSLIETNIENGKTILKGYVSIDKDENVSIKNIQLFDPKRTITLPITKQVMTDKRKIEYKANVINEELPTGEFKVKININICNKDYEREIWCSNKTGQYIDHINNLDIKIIKNRLKVIKKDK
ncbi:ABC transporter ATP-binding protein [Romboutsia sp.]|uniref:ABC transporter ATP-binding protein n=1 Tax=Romboutsia sp. TaxID=1965302 RepID=UPI003F30B94E